MDCCTDGLVNFLGHRMTALVLGFKGAIVFAQMFIFFAAFAWYSLFISDEYIPSQNIWQQIANMLSVDWFYYVYLWYCFLMFIAAVYLIQGVKARNHHKMKPFILLNVVGLGLTTAFVVLQNSWNIGPFVALIIAVVCDHIFSFVCILVHHERVRHTANYESL